jgi:hypothetical protein
MIQVSGGVQPGQIIVVQGNERLRPGQDVQIQRVLPAPEAVSRGGTLETQVR